jgi:hypothetical protein
LHFALAIPTSVHVSSFPFYPFFFSFFFFSYFSKSSSHSYPFLSSPHGW